jgi:hypothetical protein
MKWPGRLRAHNGGRDNMHSAGDVPFLEMRLRVLKYKRVGASAEDIFVI